MAEELVSYLERRAGEYLRTVATYDEETYEIAYLREDLDETVIREKTTTIYEGVQAGLGPSDVADEIGKRYATLQVREEAVVMNLPWGATEGTFVSLEPEAARQLTGFLNDCMKHGYQGSVSL